VEEKKKRTFKFLTLRERRVIEELRDIGANKTQIAKYLGVNLSTIIRELQRNSVDGKYDAVTADRLARERDRWQQKRKNKEL
jgi:hypothetical protein